MNSLLDRLKDFAASTVAILLLLSPIWAFWLFEVCCKEWIDGPISLVLLGVAVGGVTLMAAYQNWASKRKVQEIVHDPEKFKAFWDGIGKQAEELRRFNDAAYRQGKQAHLQQVQATGWLVGIWGAEQGFAVDTTGEVYTWISPNEGPPSGPLHKEVRWHPSCTPPEAVTQYILYCLPEEGPAIRLTKAYVLGSEGLKDADRTQTP